MPIEIVKTVAELREAVLAQRASGKKTALVPTMGGLHDGHLSLVDCALNAADFVVVSIFVNPKQFDNPTDFETYPGDNEQDLERLEKSGAHLVFIPSVEEMYPDGFSTNISVTAGSGILCDAHRPGHFEGVATIVAKLFLQAGTDYACFGEKDFQQLFKIRRLVRDLNIPIDILPAPTVREKDGLAMSSRNARLTPDERKIAPELNAAMVKCRDHLREGKVPKSECAQHVETLEKEFGFKVEYFEVRASDTLELLDEYEKGARLFAAAHLGSVRLIDNIAI